MENEAIASKSDRNVSLLYVTSILGIIVSIILLCIGIRIAPTLLDPVVNLHKLHLKQTLYYFSGVCFIVAVLAYGLNRLIETLSDIYDSIKK